LRSDLKRLKLEVTIGNISVSFRLPKNSFRIGLMRGIEHKKGKLQNATSYK